MILQYPDQVLRSSWLISVQWIIVVFGLIGNVSLIAIYRKKDLKLRFNSLILTLAVSDLIYLSAKITESMADYFELDYGKIKVTPHIFSHIGFSLSTFIAISMSIERYCMLCRNM